MTAAQEKLGETQRNKVGVYDETKALLATLKEKTGIPQARLVKNAMESHAKRLLRQHRAAG